MSGFTVYDAAIPGVKDALNSLSAILKKGEAAPNASSLPGAKLVEDMLPLSFQIHMVTDTASKLVARSTGVEPTKFENNLSSFDDFNARIAAVQDILAKADRDTINAKANDTVPLGMGPGKNLELASVSYIGAYALPNIFFHTVTAYNILRKEGVPVGKMDYLGPFMAQHLPKE